MRYARLGLGGVVLGLIGGLAYFFTATPQGRLIGNSYAVPEPQTLQPTAISTAQDLSVFDVVFAETGGDLGGLDALMLGLHRTAEIADGWLRLRGVPEEAGWYSDRSGPFLYREVTGDFMIETRARSVQTADGQSRPLGSYNSNGLLVRDASGSRGEMRWLMYNFGQQESFYGTEAKSTVPDWGGFHIQQLAGFDSRSTFWLTPLPRDIVEARLRICRIGDEFRFFKQLPGSDAWTEEEHTPETVLLGNGAERPTAGVEEGGAIRFLRPDMPQTVQVGIINNPGMPPHDGEGQFASLSFARITGFAECLAG